MPALCHDQRMPASVLIVDDHPRFRHFARRLLSETGFDVVGEAGDVEGALAGVAALRPDIVLLDVLLPDGSGLDVARDLASRDSPPAVILTSSRSAADLGAALEGIPARGFVSKAELSGYTLTALLSS